MPPNQAFLRVNSSGTEEEFREKNFSNLEVIVCLVSGCANRYVLFLHMNGAGDVLVMRIESVVGGWSDHAIVPICTYLPVARTVGPSRTCLF